MVLQILVNVGGQKAGDFRTHAVLKRQMLGSATRARQRAASLELQHQQETCRGSTEEHWERVSYKQLGPDLVVVIETVFLMGNFR